MDYAQILGNGSNDNMGGTGITIYFAPLEYFAIDGIKKFFANPSNLEQKVLIDGKHTFKPGKGWHRFRNIIDTTKLASEIVGERGGRGIKEKFEGKIAGNTMKMAAIQAQLKNDQFIFIIPLPNGLLVQLGTEDLPAECLPPHDTGTVEGGLNAMMLTVEAYTLRRQFYTHPILQADLHPADVLESSGSTPDPIPAVTSFSVTAVGDEGDQTTITLLSAAGPQLAVVTVEASETLNTLAARIASAISEGPSTYTATAVGNVVFVSSPLPGSQVNGTPLVLTVIGNTTYGDTPSHPGKLFVGGI